MKVRRPLFIISFSILVVIYAINTMPKSAILFSLALFALFVFIHYKTVNRHTLAMILSVTAMLFGTAYFNVYTVRLNSRIERLSAMEKVTVTGEITDKGNTSATAYYTVDIDAVNGENIDNFKVTVFTSDILQCGMKLEMTGKFKGFTPKSDYLYNYSKGVFAYFYPDNYKVYENNTGLHLISAKIRNRLADISRTLFDYKYVPVAVAMGLGEKGLLESRTKEEFSRTGISHALVVSGLHIGIIAGAVNVLLNLLPFSKKIKNIVTIVFLLLFMELIGFTPSVIRAGCLIIAMLIGRNFLIEIDSYNVLALIILVTVLSNPYSANNASLLLSYSAYFGVVHSIDISTEKEYGKITSIMLMSAFAVLYTMPVMAVLEMEVTLLSPLFNLLLSPVIMIICILSFFLPLIYCMGTVGRIIAAVMAPLNEFMISLLISFTEFSRSNFQFAVMELNADGLPFIIFTSAVLIMIVHIQLENSDRRKFITFLIPVTVFLCYNVMNRNTVAVTVFDGSSEPSFIVSYSDKNYLVMTEAINQRKFRSVREEQNIALFDEIIVCPEKEIDTEFYGRYANKLTVLNNTGNYDNGIIVISAVVESRNMTYIMDFSGVSIAFSHKKADLGRETVDFYFFGSDTPKNIDAVNSYYFYPVIKANTEMVTEKEAKELYDVLKIKINMDSGKYRIVKDVKNFGSKL